MSLLVNFFAQDENCYMYPLIQVGSGSGEKVPDTDPAGQKKTPDPHHWTTENLALKSYEIYWFFFSLCNKRSFYAKIDYV